MNQCEFIKQIKKGEVKGVEKGMKSGIRKKGMAAIFLGD